MNKYLLLIVFLAHLGSNTPLNAYVSEEQRAASNLAFARNRKDINAMRAILTQYPQFANNTTHFSPSLLHRAPTLEIAKMLVEEFGANVDIQKKPAPMRDSRPLHFHAQAGRTDFVAYLLDQGAEIDALNSLGDTPLNLAAKNAYLDTVKLLVERGAQINHPGRNGWTPLHDAASSINQARQQRFEERVAVVKYLVEQGADPHLKSNAGRTPAMFASDFRKQRGPETQPYYDQIISFLDSITGENNLPPAAPSTGNSNQSPKPQPITPAPQHSNPATFYWPPSWSPTTWLVITAALGAYATYKLYKKMKRKTGSIDIAKKRILELNTKYKTGQINQAVYLKQLDQIMTGLNQQQKAQLLILVPDELAFHTPPVAV